jgi:hypothetical protein
MGISSSKSGIRWSMAELPRHQRLIFACLFHILRRARSRSGGVRVDVDAIEPVEA